MATQGNYAATPHVSAAITVASADTSLTAPTNVATVFTAGASGSRIDTVRINQVATTAGAGVLNLFLFDGSTYHLLDLYLFGAVTLSATSEAQPVDIYFQNLIMQSGWSLRATHTQNGGSAFKVLAFGGDF